MIANHAALDWLLVLRIADLVAICLSAGFLAAVALALSARYHLPVWMHALGVSYTLFAIGSAIEIEIAISEGLPFTWRTVLVTLSAAIGVLASLWGYLTVVAVNEDWRLQIDERRTRKD